MRANLFDLIKLIGIFLFIPSALFLSIWTILQSLQKWKRSIQTKRILSILYKHPLYKFLPVEEICIGAQNYITPDCQNENILLDNEQFTPSETASNLFDEMNTLLDKPDEYKYIMLLADAGMGKTAFIYNYP